MSDLAASLREQATEHALAHADRAHPDWSALAYAFLIRYCRTHRHFTAEECTDAAREWGLIMPPDLRAFGGVYRKAVNRGVITMTGMGRSKTRASVCPLWTSAIYKEGAQ